MGLTDALAIGRDALWTGILLAGLLIGALGQGEEGQLGPQERGSQERGPQLEFGQVPVEPRPAGWPTNATARHLLAKER